ncbi:MAG: nucleotide-binding protein [Bacteroidales bacterium]|jgi:predicted nucleotide-binding protein|nr:nucleotide-binding protein [Bacteroidales bacterium]MCK9497974.1 nucleotide-binding protein [Bacteroidales bacterium]MDY0314681.1 nucleotide-binding protein [Bacteroidales bacterium]NLB86321.1 nucleotide-binding protein [Bacteroidales bacterium]
MDKIRLIEDLISEAQNLNYDDGNLDRILKRADMLIKKIFGSNTEYTVMIKKIDFVPSMIWGGMDRNILIKRFQSGKSELINLLNVMLEDLQLSNVFQDRRKVGINNLKLSKNIFLVHGHNEEMKQSCARFIEKLGLNPIILHEQPNRGRTIIEKFTEYSDVNFAVILLSADDIAFSKNDKVENAMLRARQNVILELGFFLGKIGRENVIVLHENAKNFEFPSDYQGVLFTPYDTSENWKLAIARELKEVGYNIDSNKLLN